MAILFLAAVSAAGLVILLSGIGNRSENRFVLKPGTVDSYTAVAGRDAFLNLQSKGDEAWGLLEYPDLGIYGFLAGARNKDGSWKGQIDSGAKNWDFRFARGFLGFGTTLEITTGEKPDISLKLKRLRSQFAFRLKSYEKPGPGFGGSADRIEIVQLESRNRNVAALLDDRLRRGEGSFENAQALLLEFERTLVRLSRESAGNTLMQRPYVLHSRPHYASLAAETYIFQGGAHGITVTVFNTINTETGRLLEPSDYFLGDWQKILPGRIAKEAAWQLLSVAVPGKTTGADSLSGYGLFEDELPLPSGIFPCATGFGFHYNRYEIAPGAMGDFLFILPFSELEDLLKPEWRQ